MKLNDPRYQNQGIHVDVVVFTVSERRIKTLLVKRAKGQFIGEWIVPGGGVYNTESIDNAAKRELLEKTGLSNVYFKQFYTFGDPKRDPRKRMISVAYLALIDEKKVAVLQKTPKTLDATWCDIKKLPKLAFDHKDIINFAVNELRHLLSESNIARSLLPNEFTLPELQEIYEIIMGEKYDRRNFRRKLLSLNVIKSTGNTVSGTAYRPAKLYKFVNSKIREVDII